MFGRRRMRFPYLHSVCVENTQQPINSNTEGKNYSLILWSRRWPWRYRWRSKRHRFSLTLLKPLNCKHPAVGVGKSGVRERTVWGNEPVIGSFHTDDALSTETCLNCTWKYSSYRAVNTFRLGFKNQSVNAVWEVIAVCYQFHSKHINTLCGQNVELLILNWWYI